MRRLLLLPAAALAAVWPASLAAQKLRIVTSLTTYAAIAREVAGDRAEVSSIARGDENPHFVQPRPSYVLDLKRADAFVTTGLDLELWVPALLDKAGNARIREGSPGYVTAYRGVDLLDVPASVSRAGGDIHVFGNPHLWTDPVNGVLIAENVRNALRRLDPEGAAEYDRRTADFRRRVLAAYVGAELLDLLGEDVVFDLARRHGVWDFVATRQYEGRPLRDRVGGWLAEAAAFRGRPMVCYHKEWDYFSRAFGVPCVDYIEPKPGIPPTPRHVSDIITLMRERNIRVLFSTNYYDANQVRSVAARTGAVPVMVPSNTGGAEGTETYIALITLWVRALGNAFAGRPAHP
ncbi:MAG TPA: metal ABC transporter substrate-binding protein [Gemmatimonadales bacterium]